MTKEVDEYNHLIKDKQEQVEDLMSEKKQVENLIDEYEDLIHQTEHFNNHLIDRYYDSRMFSAIEENTRAYHSAQHKLIGELSAQQSDIEQSIRQTNDDIDDLERKRNISLQIERERD